MHLLRVRINNLNGKLKGQKMAKGNGARVYVEEKRR